MGRKREREKKKEYSRKEFGSKKEEGNYLERIGEIKMKWRGLEIERRDTEIKIKNSDKNKAGEK